MSLNPGIRNGSRSTAQQNPGTGGNGTRTRSPSPIMGPPGSSSSTASSSMPIKSILRRSKSPYNDPDIAPPLTALSQSKRPSSPSGASGRTTPRISGIGGERSYYVNPYGTSILSGIPHYRHHNHHNLYPGPQTLDTRDLGTSIGNSIASSIPIMEPTTKHMIPPKSKVRIHGDSLYVRLGSIASPSHFWVSELPYRLGLQIKDSTLGKIKRLEDQITQYYKDINNPEQTNNKMMGSLSNPKEGDLVAIRRHWTHTNWYRAKILSIMSDPKDGNKKAVLKAKVFLIDYGDVIDYIPFNSCIRELPVKVDPSLKSTPGNAFQLILSGIRPLGFDINYSLGMQTLAKVFAKKWSYASMQFIKYLITNSKYKVAEITKWQRDKKSRVHGTLNLLGFDQKVNLNRLLIKCQFGMYSVDKLREDLRAESTVVTGRALSICGGSVSGDKKSNPSSNGNTTAKSFTFDDNDQTHDDETVSIPESTASSQGPQWITLPGTKKKPVLRPPLDEKDCGVEEFKPTKLLNDPEEFKRLSKLSPVQLIAAIKSKKKQHKEETRSKLRFQSSIWSAFRGDDEPKKKSEHVPRELMIPAGVDPGLFLEEQLRRLPPNQGIGPKLI